MTSSNAAGYMHPLRSQSICNRGVGLTIIATIMRKFLAKFWMIAALISLVSIGCSRSKRKEPQVVRRQEYMGNIRVEVLNATDVQGLGKRVTVALRNMGFDVRYYGNAPRKSEKTYIIDHVDRKLSKAKLLGGAIGCKAMTYAPDPDSLFDVTLILGEDYHRYFRDIAKRLFIY